MSHEVLVDNQKAAVLKHLPRNVQFSPRFVDLAQHYGFTPRACRPYRARTKGKDERMVGYLKQHFFVRYRGFESWAHLNQLLEHWLVSEADVRVHGTLKEVVRERFEQERPTLQSLPAYRYEVCYHETRIVSWDSYVEVRGNRYSVPAAYVGQTVSVRIGLDGGFAVLADNKVVAAHQLQAASSGWVTVQEHHAPLWQAALEVEHRPLAFYEEVSQWN